MKTTRIIGRHQLPLGLGDPVVFILLVAAVFDGISDNWVHALFLGAVGMALAWEAHRRRRPDVCPGGVASHLDEVASAAGGPTDSNSTAMGGGAIPSLTHDGALALDSPGGRSYARAESSGYWAVLYSAAGIAYALIVGGFPRYSWPATIAVAVLGAAMIARGWGESPARGPVSSAVSRLGRAAWTAVFVVAALWELVALLLQRRLTTGSYAHPTISVLSDPLLVSHLGRSVALLGWLGFGGLLMKR